MASTRIYISADLNSDQELQLEQGAAHHVARVLRKRVGEKLIVFNGQGGEYTATITSVQRSKVSIVIQTFSDQERESCLKIELVQALSKGEKMDFTIQKAVELGVEKITPLISEFSNVRLNDQQLTKRLEHWQKVIISACEQSGRNRLPQLNTIHTLDEWLANNQTDMKLILAPKALKTLADLSVTEASISLIIGPEGGLSQAEIEQLQQHDCQAIRLGPRILRTETAGLAAIAAIQSQFGDFAR